MTSGPCFGISLLHSGKNCLMQLRGRNNNNTCYNLSNYVCYLPLNVADLCVCTATTDPLSSTWTYILEYILLINLSQLTVIFNKCKCSMSKKKKVSNNFVCVCVLKSRSSLIALKFPKDTMQRCSMWCHCVLIISLIWLLPHSAAKCLFFLSINCQQQCLKTTTAQGFCLRQISSSSPLVC